MHQLQIFNITNMSFDVIREIKFSRKFLNLQCLNFKHNVLIITLKADDLPFLVINFIHSPSLQS